MYVEARGDPPAAVDQLLDTASRRHWPGDLQLAAEPNEGSPAGLAALREQLVTSLSNEVKAAQQASELTARRLLERLHSLQKQMQHRIESRAALLSALAKERGKELTAIERIVAIDLDCRDKKPEEILAAINQINVVQEPTGIQGISSEGEVNDIESGDPSASSGASSP